MTLAFQTPFADALRAWRRDRALLLPIAGLLMFVPQYAQLLLIPELPARPRVADEAALVAWSEALTRWMGQWGVFYLVGPALGLFGALAIMALYLSPGRPTVGGALGRSAALLFRYVLAAILVACPLGLLMLPALAAPLLLAVVLAPILYVSARTMLIAPALVAEAPLGAVAAIARSWRLTRGRGWLLACVYAVIMLGAQTAAGLFLALGAAIGRDGAANPVAQAITDGCASLATAAAALTLALVQVSLYRRLASSGT